MLLSEFSECCNDAAALSGYPGLLISGILWKYGKIEFSGFSGFSGFCGVLASGDSVMNRYRGCITSEVLFDGMSEAAAGAVGV